MDDKTLNQIEALNEEIKRLNSEITGHQHEIENLYIAGGADFEGSYVEYFDGWAYNYIKVERQVIRASYNTGAILPNEHSYVELSGPILTLSDSPISPIIDDGLDIDGGHYVEDASINVGYECLNGRAVQTIRKVTKAEMERVVNYFNQVVGEHIL